MELTGDMNRKTLLFRTGIGLLLLSIFCIAFFCTNTRIDPQVRSNYEIRTQPESDDMALLLQMLNEGQGAAQ